MHNFEWYHLSFLILAAILDIVANVFLKYSNGFKNKIFGTLSIVFVLIAFSCLAEAVKAIDLSVAYALWGGFGLIATTLAGWLLFKQQLNWRGWLGVAGLIVGMTLLKFA